MSQLNYFSLMIDNKSSNLPGHQYSWSRYDLIIQTGKMVWGDLFRFFKTMWSGLHDSDMAMFSGWTLSLEDKEVTVDTDWSDDEHKVWSGEFLFNCLVEFLFTTTLSNLLNLTISSDRVSKSWNEYTTGFIQANMSKIQGLFKDFYKTFLLFSRTENLWKILIYTLKSYFWNARVHYLTY